MHAVKSPLEATIDELAPGGDGVAIVEIDGERRAVFVPNVLPGERMKVAVDTSTRPARGRVLELLEASPDRVTPACAWFDACGACDLMFASDAARLREHAALVERLLPREWSGTTVEVTPAPKTLGYRVRARVHVEAGKRGVIVGMFGRRSHDPVSVDTCVVLDPALDRARAALAPLLDGARGRGEAQLALGKDRRPVADARFDGDLPPAVFARAEKAVATSAFAGIRIFDGDVKVPATVGDPTPWVVGADGAPLRLAPGGFSQASEEGNRTLAMRAAEQAIALCPDGGTLLELYAGAGNLTVLLAEAAGARKIVAVERDEAACAAARANLDARGLARGARVVAADAAAYAIPNGTKLVLLDPPRTGAKEVARALAQKPVPAIVYVSCDPVTLGRDLGVLAAAGYTLHGIEAFEMFPQTSHVETIAALVRSRR